MRPDKMANKGKMRADQLMQEQNLADSRSKAQALILAGLVFAGDRRIDKAGQQMTTDTVLDVRGRDHPWVSRGGVKLAHALAHFALDVNGVTAIDVGSSTGGFTDVLLNKGADHVFAVDSGTNQLAWKLRQDARVSVYEKTSARLLTPTHIDRPITLIVCDASFISLQKVLPVAMGFGVTGAHLVALIKPQFEAGRDQVGKGGVVRDPALHQEICDRICGWLEEMAWDVLGVTQSPITGPKGNIEFLVAARKK